MLHFCLLKVLKKFSKFELFIFVNQLKIKSIFMNHSNVQINLSVMMMYHGVITLNEIGVVFSII